jgi:hypothetical protein
VLVKPDGFIRLQGEDNDGHYEDILFLECDRSTEGLEILGRRAACYRDCYQRGGLASRFGHPRSEFKKFPFVVLMAFRDSERRNNIAEHPKPTAYAAATKGTAFDVDRRQARQGYRRQPEREEFVDARIEKHCLLTQTASVVR